MNDPVRQTTATYDAIGPTYAARWQERGALLDHIDRFLEWVPAGGVVVDVGCGPGLDTAVFRRRGFRVVGVDLSWGMMQAGRRPVGVLPLVQADMRALPLPAAAVDGLWASASLLHLPQEDVAQTLRRFAAVLKPGGVLYLAVKMGDDARWVPNAYQSNHSRFFTFWRPDKLDALLADAAFHIERGWQDAGGRDTWLARLALRRV
jgi:SAM-dependent methyltransferase